MAIRKADFRKGGFREVDFTAVFKVFMRDGQALLVFDWPAGSSYREILNANKLKPDTSSLHCDPRFYRH